MLDIADFTIIEVLLLIGFDLIRLHRCTILLNTFRRDLEYWIDIVT